ERATGRVLVTAQNHGFAVAPSEAREATHVSLYDGTVEGLAFPSERAHSVQFHPEAGPGPHDAWPLLERRVEGVAYAEGAWPSVARAGRLPTARASWRRPACWPTSASS